MRLYEKLKISEAQCSELTSMIGSFLRITWESTAGNLPNAVTLFSWWLEYVEKPSWLGDRLDEDLAFLGRVCALMEEQVGAAQHFEYKAEMVKFKSGIPPWAKIIMPSFNACELKEASN